MANKVIKMNTSDVEQCISKFTNVIDTIKGVNSELTRNNEILLGNWKGPAREQFKQDYAKIANTQNDFIKDISAVNKNLEKVKSKLVEQDKNLIRSN